MLNKNKRKQKNENQQFLSVTTTIATMNQPY